MINTKVEFNGKITCRTIIRLSSLTDLSKLHHRQKKDPLLLVIDWYNKKNSLVMITELDQVDAGRYNKNKPTNIKT